jgi:hypothetical protein
MFLVMYMVEVLHRVVYVAIYQKNFHLVDVQGSYSNISL